MTHSLKQVATLSGHSDRVWHLAWSPSSPLLASCSTDKSVHLASYTPSLTAFTPASSIPTSHTRTVRSLAFNPEGDTLATASFDATVGIWQRLSSSGIDDGHPSPDGDWEPLDPLEGHESECKSVAWSADGRMIASCSRDKSVWVWESVGEGEFECLAVLMEHSQDVKAVAWHPFDEILGSASYDDTIKLYSPDPYDDEWSSTHTLKSHTATVWALAFSPCGQYLASVGDDLALHVHARLPVAVEKGEVGEAERQEGGRMGPWSGQGVRIGMKERWRWEEVLKVDNVHERTIYSVDWGKGGLEDAQGGLGRILTAGGDGKINVFQITKPPSDSTTPAYSLLTSLQDAHGVSDINHAAWCTLDPAKAAASAQKQEGGERDPDESEYDVEMSTSTTTPQDTRWEGVNDLFATAGDDGTVRVWRIIQDGKEAV